MQELWRLREAGRLTPAQQALFNPLPREMLFDLSADPFGMHNLADDTRYAVHVARLSKALDRWLIETGDLSATAERDMVASMWPDLKQPGTHAPAGRFDRRGDRVSVTLRSSTPGASIGYSLSAPAQAEWRLYTRPIRLARGERIWAKAIRYGFAESPVVALVAQ